jgi:catechol 2,3-dioxygenase-like lactoylglutathione lyase family enzyme
MSDDSLLRPGRRVLHVCFCCNDTEPVMELLVGRLGMRNTMTSPMQTEPGEILGFDRDVVNAAAFVYDARGPRTSPAIEVQSWVDPPLVGEAETDPLSIGIQAVGIAVRDPDATARDLLDAGCEVVGSGPSPLGAWSTVRHRTGLQLDVVADQPGAPGPSRLRHLRINVADLAASIAWYVDLGFEVVARAVVSDGAALGVEDASTQSEGVDGADGKVHADLARLRLPDEPFELLLVQWRSPVAHGAHFTEPNHAGLFRLAVGLDDTRGSHAAMAAAGTVFDRGPISVALPGTPVPDMWISFLRDPDGVTVELVERPRSAFR